MLTPMRVRTPDKPHRVKQGALSEFDEEGAYIATAKYDGYRALLDYDGSEVGLFSRRGVEEGGPRVHPLGEPLHEQLLVWVKENKLSPNTRIDGEWLNFRTKGEPMFVVFGITYANGEWLGTQPEMTRWELVESFKYNQPNVKLAEYAKSNYTELFNRLKDEDYTKPKEDWILEGIVLKHTHSTLLGRQQKSAQNSLWFKAKWRDGASGKVDTY